MPDDGSKQSNTEWPISKFSFRVKWDGNEFNFQEVSGLSSEAQVIEYRGGNSKQFSTIKMPGLQKFGNVTLKKGIFTGDKQLWNAFNSIKMNSIKRSTITIELLDETGSPTMTWTLTNAFPSKFTVTDMKASANDIAIETLELAHEGLTIK